MEEKVKVVVDRGQWLRGEGGLSSSLLRESDSKMCCLGFACLKLGLSKEEITSVSSPRGVVEMSPDSESTLYRFINPTDSDNNLITHSMMEANDATEISDREREERIKSLGARIGLEFEFVD